MNVPSPPKHSGGKDILTEKRPRFLTVRAGFLWHFPESAIIELVSFHDQTLTQKGGSLMKRPQTRRIFLLIGLCLCLGLTAFQVQAASQLVYIGTRGTWDHGVQDGPKEGLPKDNPPQGIYAAHFDTETGHLTPLGVQAVLEASSWLVIHPNLPVLYTVASSIGGRNADTDVISYSIDKVFGKLYLLNSVKSAGRDGTHLELDVPSNTMFVANYGDGAVTALPVRPDGSLGPFASMMKDYGGRRAGSHGVAVDPTHRYVLDACSWCYRIFVFGFDAATRTLTPANPPFMETSKDTDPRHLAFHPGGRFVYVITGSSAEILTYGFDPKNGQLQELQRFKTYPADWKGPKSLAEIGISQDGRFVYASMREGQNKLIVYSVDEKKGTLTEIQRISATGESPWSFTINPTGRWMLVTNTDSDSVDVFKIDPPTGKLTATKESMRVPKPQAVVFYAN
jgi:6-phosphogluconolactonase